MASALLRLLFDHVAPGGPQSFCQRGTDPGQGREGWSGGTEPMDGAVITGQRWRGEDLQTDSALGGSEDVQREIPSTGTHRLLFVWFLGQSEALQNFTEVRRIPASAWEH